MNVAFQRHVLLVVIVLFPFYDVAAEDWPWFLGPRHDGTSTETDLQLNWPATGPKVLWKQSVGTGYSAPSVLGEKVVLHHRVEENEVVTCRSASTGEKLWEHKYESSFSDPYGYNNGPRCSPVLEGDRCYTLGADGILCSTDLTTGKLIWQHKLKDEFDLPDWFFGVGCTPIIDGERLIVPVGGQPNSGIVAFNKVDGTVLWESVGKDTWDGVIDANSAKPHEWSGSEMVISYASPVIATIHSKRHLLCFVRQGLVSLDPATGEQNFQYWFRPKVHESVNAACPVVIGDQIFLSAAYRLGSVLLKVNPDGKSVTQVWANSDNMLAHWSTPIHVDGFLFGFSGRHENEGELRCIRVSDGEVMWQTTGSLGPLTDFGRDRATGKIVNLKTGLPAPFPYFGRGSLTQVGDRFIVLGERGTLAVVDVDSQEFKEQCRTSFDEIHYPAWTAPVIANKQMYLRSEDWLICLDLRKE